MDEGGGGVPSGAPIPSLAWPPEPMGDPASGDEDSLLGSSFLYFFFGGLEDVGHSLSFAYVAHFVFLGDVWIRTQRAAVASRCATNLATHLPNLATLLPDLSIHLPNLATHLLLRF
jgi:hypothetical protein